MSQYSELELYIAYTILAAVGIFIIAPMIGNSINPSSNKYKDDLLAGLAFIGFISAVGAVVVAIMWALAVVGNSFS